MDYELLRYPAMVLFILSFGVESAVSGKLFLQRENLPVGPFMKWWAVFGLGFLSMMNFIAAWEVSEREVVDSALVIKMGYAFAGLSIVAWVFVFHIDKWKAGRGVGC